MVGIKYTKVSDMTKKQKSKLPLVDAHVDSQGNHFTKTRSRHKSNQTNPIDEKIDTRQIKAQHAKSHANGEGYNQKYHPSPPLSDHSRHKSLNQNRDKIMPKPRKTDRVYKPRGAKNEKSEAHFLGLAKKEENYARYYTQLSGENLKKAEFHKKEKERKRKNPTKKSEKAVHNLVHNKHK